MNLLKSPINNFERMSKVSAADPRRDHAGMWGNLLAPSVSSFSGSLPPSIIHGWTFMNDYSSSKDQCPSACRQMALIFWVYGSPFFTWMALETNMSLSLGLAGAVLPAASGGCCCCCCCCWTLPYEGLTRIITHPRRQTIINVLSLIILHSSQGDTDLPHSTPCGDTHTQRERERERERERQMRQLER